MKKILLDGQWRMEGGGFDCTGTVPGSVCSFLLDAGLMEDPFYRDNELKTLQILQNVFTFSRSFDFMPTGHRVLLRCEGLDTLCQISVNGTNLASTQNMHRTYEFDVTDVLRQGENTISVRFDPAVPYVLEKHKQRPMRETQDPVAGFPYLRKANCMFGWDWGPRIPDAGIWRGISLLVLDSPRITNCRILQEHRDCGVYLTVQAQADSPCQLEALLTDPDGMQTLIPCNTPYFIEQPRLWWPNGLGRQDLYRLTVRAVKNSTVADTVEKSLGLRTMELVREKDQWGESFYHRVNGLSFFAMGADYIPEDCVLSRVTPERTRQLLQHCKDANFNAIRVWGGGQYPDDSFFELCDEMGIVVFLDMMLACGFLPDDPALRQEMVEEVRDNLTRIRHHACLAVLSGNNEVEEFGYIRAPDPDIAQGYLKLFEEQLPEVVRQVCPELPYIPSSPTSFGGFVDPKNENYGDSHYWEVWHKDKPYSEYRSHYFRYLSEFGFQSFPCEKTVNAFTEPEDRNIFSRVMERHQRNKTANGKILSYLSQTFLYPQDFGTLLYASQLLQSTAIQYGVEHLRRNRGRCMGALYWQLNDIWPVASWASIDYYGRWKALHYTAKRFFAPVMISCEEVGETATRPSVNAQPWLFDFETTAVLAVSNESRVPVTGTVHWQLCAADSTVLCSGRESLTVPAQSCARLEKLDFEKTDVERNHLFYWFEVEGETVSRGSVLFTAPKHYQFRDPKLCWERQGDTITVYADSYAKWVEIDSPDSDFILSDNYFDMERGSRTVKLLSGEPKTIRLRSVYDIR